MSEVTASIVSKPNDLQLNVLSGIHEGVSIPIGYGEYSIGSVPDADIVLRDDGVAPYHVIIRFEKTDLRVEAVGGDILIDGETLEGGHGCRVRLPSELTIGQASIQLSRDGHQAELTERIPVLAHFAKYPAVVTLGAAGLAAVLAAVTIFQSGDPVNGPLKSLSTAATAPSSLSVTGSVPGPAAPPAITSPEASAVLDALKVKLDEAGMQAMKVSANGGQISVAGQIPESQAESWASVQRWFDQNHAPKFVMTANIAIGEAVARPALRLQAVWYGERPYIITDSGLRHYEGAILDNGWVLQQIRESGVVLRKDRERLTLTFR
jgi:hypothetical protein